MTDFVILRCLQSGKLYPDYNTEGLRYCGAGDLIHIRPEDVQNLIERGLCEKYERRENKNEP